MNHLAHLALLRTLTNTCPEVERVSTEFTATDGRCCGLWRDTDCATGDFVTRELCGYGIGTSWGLLNLGAFEEFESDNDDEEDETDSDEEEWAAARRLEHAAAAARRLSGLKDPLSFERRQIQVLIGDLDAQAEEAALWAERARTFARRALRAKEEDQAARWWAVAQTSAEAAEELKRGKDELSALIE